MAIEAIRTKDIETKRELEIETRKLQAEINRVEADYDKLVSTYIEEKTELEKRMELMDSSHREAERVSAENQHEFETRLRGGFFTMMGRAIDSVFGH